MRHFIYQDEKSHKFWAVEQQGNELHISWGKVGTNGQSQIKSFADAAAAAKAELKLIAEKTKKGYVENASANVHIPPITKATPEVETSPESKNQRPWLADDAVIRLTDDINRFAFPHRSRPREINYLHKDGQIWQLIANNTRAYDPANNYRSYPENWQQAFAELQMRVQGNQQTGSAQSDAALLWSFWNSYSADELVDDLVIRCGLESAVEIALLALQLRYKPVKGAVTTIIPPNHKAESLPSWHQRLCHHLSLASEDEWQRCVDKVLAAIPTLSPARQPFAALLLPECPDTLLQTLMASQPQLAAEVMPWLSTQARAVLKSYLSALPKPVIDGTDNSNLPEILVSPPWRSKKKMTAPRLDLARLELTPQVYWQPGERERLAATEPARYFSTESLAERMEQKSGRVVLQELGFGDDVWLFLNYILPGKLDAARNSLIVQWHYYQGRVEEILNGWNSPEAQLAEQALRSGHVEALINIWENDNYSRYRPEKSVWNLYLLAQLPREMALTFWLRINEKKHLFAGEDYFLSILGLDALPGLLLAFSHRPKETFPLILNFGATELALPVARVWRRFAVQRDLARQWILQWPEHTATALIPLAFTKPSDNSEAALLALRLLYEQGHGELLQTVANRWQRADVWPALEQLLKQGPMDIYPARIPKAPDFWHPAMWSRPRLITNNQPVTDDALEIIGEMLRFTQGGRFYSGLEQLKTFCQPQTLAAFAWDLFTAWQQAGAPAKDNWAFLALSLFGDESTARDLTTQILAWPQEGKSARAVSGLNILTLMNNDMALIQLHHISQRAKSRPLRDNAAEFLQVVAENRGLSQEELADRLVPTLGLDDPQALSFDFGPRQFTVRFDENLNPVIFDQQNVRQKSVPRLRADDDQLKAPEALARLKGQKKDATQVSKNLLPRLETALRTTRRWSLADFHSLFVNHPFTRLVTQRLIWGAYPANEPRCLLNAFRVAAEGEFCNAQDEPIDLPADALIGIAHPLEMTVEMRSEFAQLFADYEIMPPFRQLSRRTVLLTPDESTSNSLTRWEGKSATVGQLMGMRYKGWESGYEDAFVYDLGEYRLVLKFSPGFNHYNVDSKALMSFRSLRVYRDNKSVTFAELDVFDLSEALSAPDVIFH
ncbi:WGR and DUF4132 domain-containing protein [Escherichia coli]|nr:WGR and DUF4132 domain-containing protein [Escherichia coli]